ncbi:DUF366 family protein [bacterium]|nr:DUF366 family protein [bacterium]
MKSLIIREPIEFDISAMRPHWAHERFELLGDSIVAFHGRCNIPEQDFMDLRKRKKGPGLYAKDMLHFVAEQFQPYLEMAVLRQYLLVLIAEEKLEHRVSPNLKIIRWHDDLFLNNRKLTVTAVAKTPVSTKIHLGINIDPTGATQPAVGLTELGVDPFDLAEAIVDQYKLEMREVREKVWSIREIK